MTNIRSDEAYLRQALRAGPLLHLLSAGMLFIDVTAVVHVVVARNHFLVIHWS